MKNQHVVTRSQHLIRKWTDVFGIAQKSKYVIRFLLNEIKGKGGGAFNHKKL